MNKKLKSQPRIAGARRIPTHASLLPEIEARIADDAFRYGVSKSWVRATILAEYYRVDAPDFRETRGKNVRTK